MKWKGVQDSVGNHNQVIPCQPFLHRFDKLPIQFLKVALSGLKQRSLEAPDVFFAEAKLRKLRAKHLHELGNTRKKGYRMDFERIACENDRQQLIAGSKVLKQGCAAWQGILYIL